MKYIIEHPSMNTVYAIACNSNKRTSEDVHLLYAVSGKDLFNQAQGFTFSIHPDSFGHLIQTWKPAEVCLSSLVFPLFRFFANFSRILVNHMI